MKRTFRVATVFTGAAACGAALAPAAHAATAAPGATAALRPAVTHAGNCPVSETNSVRLYYTSAENHLTPLCAHGVSVGSPSIWGTAGKRFSSYCGGEYSGFLFISGVPAKFTAGTAFHLLHNHIVSGIEISKINPARTHSLCP
jgi:hypothetical protein